MAPYSMKTARAFLALTAATIPFSAFAQETVAVAAAPASNLPAIVVTKAETRPLIDRVVATGSIKAVEEIYVQPLVEGLSIQTLEADVGDKVEANSVLATLTNDSLLLQKSQQEANKARAEAALAQYKAQLVDARVTFEEAERQRQRAEQLGKNGTFSTSQVEQATTNALSARAKLTSTEQAISIAEADIKVVDTQIADIDLRLARTDVRTKVGGLVSARSAKIGAIASGSGTPLFTLIRDNAVELVADVSETDILKIKVGQEARISVAGGVEKLTGKVRLVSPTVDPQTRLGAVHIEVDDDDSARVGMYASAEVIIARVDGVALPLSAVTTEKTGSTARRVENDVVKQVKINIGIQDGAYIQVVDGLNAGDEVVAKAGAFVRDGDRINPVRQADSVSN